MRGKKASAIVLIAVLVVAVVGVFLILSGMPGGPTGASVKRFRSDSFPHQLIVICHEGETKIIPLPALLAHLAHEDTLGPCVNPSPSPTPSTEPSPSPSPEPSTSPSPSPSPSPSTEPSPSPSPSPSPTATPCPSPGPIAGGGGSDCPIG